MRPEELNHLFEKRKIKTKRLGLTLSCSHTKPPISQTLALLCCPFSASSTSIWGLHHRQPGTTLFVSALRLHLCHLLQSSSPFFFFLGRASVGLSLKPFFAPFFFIFFLFLRDLLAISELCLRLMELCSVSLFFSLLSPVFFFLGTLFLALGPRLLL